jgi:hypothetical protein
MIIILLSLSFNCEKINLEKKSFLRQVTRKAVTTNQNTLTNKTNTTTQENKTTITNNTKSDNSSSLDDSICAQAKEYQELMLEVEVSLKELMYAFQDHLKDLRLFENTTEELSEKLKWKSKIRDMLDYYINKTAELLDVYTNLNITIHDIKSVYCSPKNVNAPEIKKNLNITNTTNVNQKPNITNPTNVVNTTNITSISNNSSRKINTTNSTASPKVDDNKLVVNYRTSEQNQKSLIPIANKESDENTSSSGSNTNVISIFIQQLQEAATESGLPTNYVETRLRELQEINSKQRLIKRNRRLRRHF